MDVLSKRGKEKFVHEGYMYVFEKGSKKDHSLKFWVCERKNTCKARLYIKSGRVVKQLNFHNHDSCPVSIEVAEAITKIKKRAEETTEGTIQVSVLFNEKLLCNFILHVLVCNIHFMQIK